MTGRFSNSRSTLILKLLITAGLLYVVFVFVPLREAQESVREANVLWVFLAFALALPQALFSAIRLKILLDWQTMTLPLWRVLEVNMIAFFYGTILPGELAGGAVRWRRLTCIEKKGAEALAAIVYNRLISTTLLVVVGLAFLIWDPSRGLGAMSRLGVGAFLIGCVVFYQLAVHPKAHALGRHGSRRLTGFLPSFLKNAVRKLADAMTRFHHLPWRSFGLVVGLSLFEHLVGIVVMYLLALSLGVEITLFQVAWVRSAVLLLTLIPVSVSGLGVREGGLFLMLTPMGVVGPQIVAFSFLLLAKNLFLAAVGGLIELKGVFFNGGRAAATTTSTQSSLQTRIEP